MFQTFQSILQAFLKKNILSLITWVPEKNLKNEISNTPLNTIVMNSVFQYFYVELIKVILRLAMANRITAIDVLIDNIHNHNYYKRVIIKIY